MMNQRNLKTTLQKHQSLKKTAMVKRPIIKTQDIEKKPQYSNFINREITTTKLSVHAKTGSKRLIGDLQESQAKHTFEKLGIAIEATKNSGATNFDGDFLIHLNNSDYIRAEVKFRNTEGFTISKENWKMIKLKSLTNGGTPALITINSSKEKLITLNLEDLALLLRKDNDQ